MRQEATESLIIKHEGLIYYTLDLIGCKRTDEALSVAYEALWRAIETFDSKLGTKFSTYAVTCIRNAIYDLYRSQREVMSHEVFLEDLKIDIGREDTRPDEIEPTERYIFVQEAVDEVLKRLPDKKRSIAVSWIGSNRSTTAIAKDVGCSQSYVSQVVGQVKYLIRQELINAGYSPDSVKDTEDV